MTIAHDDRTSHPAVLDGQAIVGLFLDDELSWERPGIQEWAVALWNFKHRKGDGGFQLAMGVPQAYRWMVYFMENPTIMDDFWVNLHCIYMEVSGSGGTPVPSSI